MPEVPRYGSRVAYQSAQSPRRSIAQASSGGNLGDKLFKIAVDFTEKQGQARRASYLSKLEIEATSELNDLELQAEQNPDFRQAPHLFRDQVSKIREKYLSSIEDPIVLGAFTKTFDTLAIAKDLNVRRSAFKKEVDDERAFLDTSVDSYARLMAQSKNDFEREEYKKLGLMAIQRHAEAGWIKREEAVAQGRKLLSKSDEINARQRLLNDEEVDAVYLDLLDPEKYTDLDPTRRVELTKMAAERQSAIRTARIAEDNRRDKLAEKRLKQDQEGLENQLLADIDGNNPPTIEMLGRLAITQRISQEGYRMLRSELQRVDEGTTDRQVLKIALDMMSGGENARQFLLDNSDKLSKADFKSLMIHNETVSKTDWRNSEQSFYLKSLRVELGAEGFNVSLQQADAARVGRAQVEYYERVRAGENAKDVYEDLRVRYAAITAGPDTLPTPRFARSKPDSLDAVKEAATLTLDAFNKGLISSTAYEHEVKNLLEWRRYYERQPVKTQQSQPSGGKATVAPRR